jgi:hypothetical protein
MTGASLYSGERTSATARLRSLYLGSRKYLQVQIARALSLINCNLARFVCDLNSPAAEGTVGCEGKGVRQLVSPAMRIGHMLGPSDVMKWGGIFGCSWGRAM